MATGIVKWYNDAKQFGFAVDLESKELILLTKLNIINDPQVVFEFEMIEYDICKEEDKNIGLNIKTIRKQDMSFYDHEFVLLDDERIHLSKYIGKVLLVVNTASHCGLTPQYNDLEELYTTYKDQGFLVLAFPSSNFANQEFDSNDKIKDFCDNEYGITFPVFTKTHVVPFTSTRPGLREKNKNNPSNSFFNMLGEKTGHQPQWNFHKYLINRTGTEVISFNYDINPLSEQIKTNIERMLKE